LCCFAIAGYEAARTIKVSKAVFFMIVAPPTPPSSPCQQRDPLAAKRIRSPQIMKTVGENLTATSR
jgi:hypothetical protein